MPVKTHVERQGRRGRAVAAFLLATGLCSAFCATACAQDAAPSQNARRPDYFASENQFPYVAVYYQRWNGGPYKGFFPCNSAIPYYGGACHVYGDAPIYSAPADYGHHCALWCR